MAFKKKKKLNLAWWGIIFFPLLDTLTCDQYMLFFQNFGMGFHI